MCVCVFYCFCEFLKSFMWICVCVGSKTNRHSHLVVQCYVGELMSLISVDVNSCVSVCVSDLCMCEREKGGQCLSINFYWWWPWGCSEWSLLHEWMPLCMCVCYMRSCLITLILTYMWTMLKRHGPGSKQVLNAHGSCRCGLQLSKHFTVIPVWWRGCHP